MTIAINFLFALGCAWLIKYLYKRDRKELAIIVGVFYLLVVSCQLTYLVIYSGYSIGSFISTLK